MDKTELLKQKVLERFTQREMPEVVKFLEGILVSEDIKFEVQSAIIELSDCNLSQLEPLTIRAEENPKGFLVHFHNWKNFDPGENDIRIGEFKVIKWIDFSLHDPSYSVDHLLEPIRVLFDGLETVCDRMCCGIGAFDFLPESIRLASAGFNTIYLEVTIDQILENLNSINASSVQVRFLNNGLHKTVLIELLKHIKMHL